ncbi:MAG: molecular chaperone DnaJ [bacterium]
MKNYYQTLGVSKGATADEIKKAYRKLAHQYHPDKGGDGNKFKEINEAYQVLSDASKKQQYDQYGQVFDGVNQGQQPGYDGQGFGFRWGGWGAGERQGQDGGEFNAGDLGDIFEEVFGFGGGGAKKRDLKRGKDIEVDVEVTLESVLKSSERDIFLNTFVVCSRCQSSGAEPGTSKNECSTCRGAGEVQQVRRTVFGSYARMAVCPECQGEGNRPTRPCNVCGGEGRVKGMNNIKINIPIGVDNSQILKAVGKGEAGRRGGKPGDLYLRIFVKEDKIFTRKGDDLYTTKNITFSRAALGGEVEIPTLENTAMLMKVPSGVESGKVFKISQKGVPQFSGYGRGNLYVKIVVKTPAKLTRRQKELLEELQKEGI